jgi:flagellar L-ring protein FlgH
MTGIQQISKVLIPILLFSLMGCATLNNMSKLPEEKVILDMKQEPMPVPSTPPPQPFQAKPSEGSLWQPNGTMSSLFVDYKARSVGDIVTILVVEDAKASNNADTSTGKTSDLSAGVTSLLGMENKFETGSKFPNPFGKVAGSLENSFTGSGTTERAGKIKAEITANVTDVLPNGNLRIAGTRMITINSERQFIVLAGIIRPRDVSSDNKIESTRISDARIVYSGVGVIDELQRQGWLSRIVNSVWPL